MDPINDNLEEMEDNLEDLQEGTEELEEKIRAAKAKVAEQSADSGQPPTLAEAASDPPRDSQKGPTVTSNAKSQPDSPLS